MSWAPGWMRRFRVSCDCRGVLENWRVCADRGVFVAGFNARQFHKSRPLFLARSRGFLVSSLGLADWDQVARVLSLDQAKRCVMMLMVEKWFLWLQRFDQWCGGQIND